MKTIILTLLTSISMLYTSGQTDKNGNPVFNSEIISVEKLDKYDLTSSYYTITDNISNKESSVYINDSPTLDDYLTFARDLPSYTFLLHKKEHILAMIMLLQKNEGEKTSLNYHIIFPHNDKSIDIPCNVWGEISEKRVEELEKIKPDTASSFVDLPNGSLYVFNKIGYRIQSYSKLKAEVIELGNQIMKAFEKEK